jgi:hypothetical protein
MRALTPATAGLLADSLPSQVSHLHYTYLLNVPSPTTCCVHPGHILLRRCPGAKSSQNFTTPTQARRSQPAESRSSSYGPSFPSSLLPTEPRGLRSWNSVPGGATRAGTSTPPIRALDGAHRGRDGRMTTPPSEPYERISRIRLSSWWLPAMGLDKGEMRLFEREETHFLEVSIWPAVVIQPSRYALSFASLA